MCGIAGVIRVSDKEVNENQGLVEAAIKSLSHRGPDDQGFFNDERVSLGMCRLSILDIDNGQQPNFDSQRTIVSVFNGEIYNFRELRGLIPANALNSKTYGDSVLIPHLFEKFGPEFVSLLRGQFAIAIVDLKTRTTYLYRDRFGEKPLWYASDKEGLKFASELKGLMDLKIQKEIDVKNLREFLRYGYINAPRSIFRSTFQVKPGHYVTFSQGNLEETRYWKPDSNKDFDFEYLEAMQATRDALLESIEMQMVSERNIGVFLSGGIDSSLVTSYARKLTTKRLKTFSIGFHIENFDESRHAANVANFLGTDHYEKKIDADPGLIVDEISKVLDHPFADSSVIPTYLLAKFASNEVTVALGGDGGDEAFGGYTRYRAVTFLDQINPVLTASPARSLAKLFPNLPLFQKFIRHAKKMDAGLRYDSIQSEFSEGELDSLFEKKIEFLEDPNLLLWSSIENKELLRSIQILDLLSYLPGDLMYKSDICSMANSLELRAPMLDYKVVELGLSLPRKFKLRGTLNKRILRDLLYLEVPRELVDRPKMGFGVPIADWLRGDLHPLMQQLLNDKGAKIYDWLDFYVVKDLVDKHTKGADKSKQIWPLIVLELWFQNWVKS